ncbi:hypothetical protein [Dactylosporangium darangshiense]|uniref:hypothetical protein n=1 Tax=Dactylosporangium darangshiense TaxID=579108 RepID=UPI00363AB13B
MRQPVTSAGGRARAPAGERAANTPAPLARRIDKAWLGLSADERGEVRSTTRRK